MCSIVRYVNVPSKFHHNILSLVCELSLFDPYPIRYDFKSAIYSHVSHLLQFIFYLNPNFLHYILMQ